MPNSAYYQQLINSSTNLQKFLNLIGWAEGADYNIGFGGRVINDLSWHPYAQRQFRYGNSTTSAAGKYQFQRGTWDNDAGILGLQNFSPQSQDIAAVYEIDKAGALNDVLQGNVVSAVSKTQNIWQSFITRPLQSIVNKFGNTTNNFGVQNASIFDTYNPSDYFNQFLGVEVLGQKNRYLIAFVIIVIIFVFAFN